MSQVQDLNEKCKICRVVINKYGTIIAPGFQQDGSHYGKYGIPLPSFICPRNSGMDHDFVVLDAVKIAEKVQQSIPIGTILAYGGINPPDGYLVCDGSVIDPLVNDGKYKELYTILGTRFDVNNQAHLLPNLNGKVIIGAKPNQYEFGSTHGKESIYLTEQHIPQHSHMVDGDTHSGNSMYYRSVNANNLHRAVTTSQEHVTGFAGGDYNDSTDTNWPLRIHTHHIHLNTSTWGSNNPSELSLLQPSLALNYIIKY